MTVVASYLAWAGAGIASAFVGYMLCDGIGQVYRAARWRIARRRINKIHAEMRGAAARRAIQ